MRFKKPDQSWKDFLDLEGDVKKVMQVTYKALTKSGQTMPGDIRLDSEYEYLNYIITLNPEGIKIHERYYGPNEKKDITFNEKGLEVERMEATASGQLLKRAVHLYSPTDKILSYTMHLVNGDLAFRGIYVYNESDQMVENLVYQGKEDKLTNKTVYTYSPTGKSLTCLQYDGEGNLKHGHYKKYDELDNEIENWGEYTDENMKTYNRHTYQEFNAKGDVIFQQVIKHDGSEKIYTYTPEYDSKGKRIIKKTDDEDDDENKKNLSEIREDDSRGNWIKKIISQNGIPITIIIRELLYADEPGRELVHPRDNVTTTETTEKKKPVRQPTEPFSFEEAKFLSENPNQQAETFPLQRYYAVQFKEVPSLVTYSGPNIEAMALLKELQEHLHAEMIHSYSTVWNGYTTLQRYTLEFPYYKGYLLQATSISQHPESEFIIPEDLDIKLHDYARLSSFHLLKPHANSTYLNTYFEEWLSEYIDSCSLRKKPDKPKINMIEVRGTSFATVEYPVHNNFTIRDLDVNYGQGFEKFHNDLMQRFGSSKGLILFHGHPGTGKTYYIRHLLRQLAVKRKNVIYMPPNMVDHLVDPAFMTFLSAEVRRWSHDGNSCALLIEDAEPLLAKRQEGVRIQGVTNLLNMTDGLLNDMLNLQIICTFNVDLRKLDSALLRPGRLIARKEFKALSVLDANLLAQRLGIKHHFTKPATLGEIYSMQKNQHTLIHDVEQDKGTSTAIDDLV